MPSKTKLIMLELPKCLASLASWDTDLFGILVEPSMLADVVLRLAVVAVVLDGVALEFCAKLGKDVDAVPDAASLHPHTARIAHLAALLLDHPDLNHMALELGRCRGLALLLINPVSVLVHPHALADRATGDGDTVALALLDQRRHLCAPNAAVFMALLVHTLADNRVAFLHKTAPRVDVAADLGLLEANWSWTGMREWAAPCSSADSGEDGEDEEKSGELHGGRYLR